MGAFICPMHGDVRLSDPGPCPKCGMTLVHEDARFRLVRHLASNPLMLSVMFALMFAAMAGAMMLMR